MGGKRYLYTLKVCLKKINYKAARIRKKIRGVYFLLRKLKFVK